MENQPNIQVLFVSENPDNKYSVKSLLTETNCNVHFSQSKIRAFQLLSVEQFNLIIADLQIPKTTGIDFCKALRSEKRFRNIPIILVGEDDNQGSNCISGLKAGADDFVQSPFIPGVFLARVNRFLIKKTSSNARSYLSVQVSSGDLPGILQYLEAEIKTGKLNIKGHDDRHAVICFHEGRMVNANAPFCEGLDAVTEVLSWDSSHVTFQDVELQESEIKFNFETTGTIMNCVVGVDEFREMKKSMPPNDAMFVPGSKTPGKDLEKGQMRIYEFATKGYSLEDLLTLQKVSVRKSTAWMHQLLENKYLKVTLPPFKNYTKRSYETYKGSQIFIRRFQEIKSMLAEVQFPIPEQRASLPFGAKDWMATAPKIIITGDNFDDVSVFVQSLGEIATYISKTKPIVRKNVKGVISTRLFFNPKEILDIQQLPPAFDKLILNTLNDFITDAYAVVFVISSQDKVTNSDNLRILRILRQRFQGIYFFIVPQVPNKNNISEFRIDCSNCNFKLAVDMKMAGAIGECPICRASLTIPDCLDHLAHSLKLPDDVPIAQLRPHVMNQCRDLLNIIIDNILTACNPPEVSEQEEKKPIIEQDLSDSKVRGRKNKSGTPITSAAENVTEISSSKPEAVEAEEKIDSEESIEQNIEMENESPSLSIDDLINTDEDQFDIDEFIKSVRGVR